MAFFGVEFIAEDGGGVELVHVNWCTPRKKEVFWPPFKTKAQFASSLKKGGNPDEKNWKLYGIKQCFFSTDNYEHANKVLTKYQITSDISDGDDDRQLLVKRKCIPPRRLSYGTSDEEELGRQNKDKAVPPRRPPRIDIDPLTPSNSSVSVERSSLSSTITVISDATGQSTSSNSDVQASSPSCSNGVNVGNISQGDKNYALLVLIKEQNSQILQWIKKQNCATINVPQQVLAKDIPVKLPVSTLADVNTIENYLLETNNLTLMIRYCASLGGRDIPSRVNNIMRSLMSNQVAQNFSFLGTRARKTAFKNLSLKQVVGATQLACPTATEKEVCDYVKVWLKHAPQRLSNEKKKAVSATF